MSTCKISISPRRVIIQNKFSLKCDATVVKSLQQPHLIQAESLTTHNHSPATTLPQVSDGFAATKPSAK